MEMQSGHVAMIDVLGWKGIWSRNPVESVLASVRAVRQAAAEMEQIAAMHSDPLFQLRALFLSDTVVLTTNPLPTYKALHSRLRQAGREQLSWLVADVIRKGALLELPLTFRGAIADGEFLVDKYQILGQAVDEAAEAMGLADAAIVWFVSSRVETPPATASSYQLDYDMPLRDGRVVRVQAINPFHCANLEDEVDRIYAGILKPFSESSKLDVVIKKQKTQAFLSVAREKWMSYKFRKGKAGRSPRLPSGPIEL